MKIKSTILIGALALSINAYSQFFDSVPYRGAFGIFGGTRGTVNGFKGYDPDPTNNDADWTKPWANFAPNTVAYPGDPAYNSTNSQFYTVGTAAEKVTITSDITSDFTMTNNKWYELSGLIHVTAGATLTIQPGTCIRGNVGNLGGLIIAQGAKINAIADRNHPIVITSGKAVGSRVRGDWAGLLILGNASTNLPAGQRRFEALPSDPLAMYGGVPANDADNSGTIRYMRVEFAGYNYLPDQEINGVTFGGVGSSSHFDYIQSSFANDDAFEWFGGTCNHKYLIAFSGTDDDFDMDEGYRGKCQYFLGLRNAGLTETSPGGACNGLEHDNNTNLGTPAAVNPNITAPLPTTAPTISNMTLVGPEHPGAAKTTLSTLWQQRGGEAFRLRTNDATGVFNSIVWGYGTLLNMPNVNVALAPSVQTRASDDELSIRNTVFITSPGDVKYNSSAYPNIGWPSGANAWTGLGDVGNWLKNGPSVSVFNYTGPTANDTARTAVSSADITHPDYSGVSNGSLSQMDYSAVDFTLTGVGSAYYGTSSFQHPRISITPTANISVSTTFLASFNQTVGTPSASKMVVVKVSNITGGVTINAPTGFEVSANGTTGWSASFTKGTTPADTLIFVRMNKPEAGSASGYVTIASLATPKEFSNINVAVSGTAFAPATPFINVSSVALTFENAVGSPLVLPLVVSANNLTSNLNVSAPANFEISSTPGSGFGASLVIAQNNGKIIPTQLFVRYNPGAYNMHSGILLFTSANADTIKVTLNGNSSPSFTITPASVTLSGGFALQFPVLNTVAGTPSIAVPVMISGIRLVDTVKVNVPTGFEMSLDSAFTTPVLSSATLYLNTSMSSALNQKIYVRLNLAAAGTGAGNLTIKSTGAPLTYSGATSVVTGPGTQIVNLSGRAVASGAKYITLTAPSYQLTYSGVLGVASAPQAIIVAGYNLGNDSVVVNAPTNWEISLTGLSYSSTIYLPNTAGAVAPTTIWVRYNPTVPMALNQFVIVNVSSGTATPNSNTATNLVELVFGVASPTVVCDRSAIPVLYTTKGKPSMANSFKVSGYNLQDKVTVSATNGFEVSLDSLAFSASVIINQTAGVANATKVFVRYNSSVSGSASGSFLSISTLNGSTIPVTVSGVSVLPPNPLLTLSTGTLAPFFTLTAGPTASQSFTLSALNLQDSLSVSIGSDFEISSDSLTGFTHAMKVGGDANGNITTTKMFCRYNRTTAGTSTDSIVFMGMNLAPQIIHVSGRNAVGLAETQKISGFLVYPNPANSLVNVDFTLSNTGSVQIHIMDVMGRIIKEIPSNELYSSGHNTVSFDVSDINTGLYFVNIQSATGKQTSRLLISK